MGFRSRHKSNCFRGKKRGKFEKCYIKAVSDCSSTLVLSVKRTPLRNRCLSEITFDLHFLLEIMLCIIHCIMFSYFYLYAFVFGGKVY
jgi:hypothetical protein